MAENTARLLASGTKAILRIGYTTITGHSLVPDITREFRNTNPDVRLDLTYLTSPEQRDRILQDEIDLGFIEPNPAIFNNRAHMFLAEGCEHVGAQVLDEGEDIEVVPTPVVEALRMLHNGQITHALVHVALSRYAQYRNGQLALEAQHG